jgi:hypothetical protein
LNVLYSGPIQQTEIIQIRVFSKIEKKHIK